MPVLTLNNIDIAYIKGYNPIALSRRMSKHACIGGKVTYQVFDLVGADNNITISGEELITTVKSILVIFKNKGTTYSVVDQWGNEFTVLIKDVQITPIKGADTICEYSLALWVTAITKLFNISW